MSQEFDAIYDRGVFRPLGPVDLPDQTKVHLQLRAADGSEASAAEAMSAQKAALDELLEWVGKQPRLESDEISAGDHDLLLYGWNK